MPPAETAWTRSELLKTGAVSHLVEASHSLPTTLGMWNIPKNVKRPQSHLLQRVRTNTCLVRTKLLHLRGQNQTHGKRRGEWRVAVKIVLYSSPTPHPTPGNPQYTFPLSFPQQRYNQKKISFGGAGIGGGGDMGKNSQITTGISPNRFIPLSHPLRPHLRVLVFASDSFLLLEKQGKERVTRQPSFSQPCPDWEPRSCTSRKQDHLWNKAWKCPDHWMCTPSYRQVLKALKQISARVR